jgi:hypothetical protein
MMNERHRLRSLAPERALGALIAVRQQVATVRPDPVLCDSRELIDLAHATKPLGLPPHCEIVKRTRLAAGFAVWCAKDASFVY